VSRTLWVLAAALAAAIVLLSGREAARHVPEFIAWVHALGPWGPLAFIAGYAVVSLLLMPAFLLTLAAGALWGFWWGLLFAMAGAAVGSTASFLAARHLVRRRVEAYVARHPRLAAIDRAVEVEGARLVFLLRLSPAVPYVLLNYILGITRVRLRDHLLGLVGMTPPAAMYVYTGKLAGDIAALVAGVAPPRGSAYYALLSAGLGATVLATALVTRAARRSLVQAIADAETEPAMLSGSPR
jgi:uncharacterized membrane protein YdjX (TVP38/TMEM64 family)